jgi:hypothetical protein
VAGANLRTVSTTSAFGVPRIDFPFSLSFDGWQQCSAWHGAAAAARRFFHSGGIRENGCTADDQNWERISRTEI